MNDQRHPLATNWRDNTRSRLRDIGCQSIAEFLAKHPGVPYVDLPEILAGNVAAPISIAKMQFEEANAKGEIRAAALDCMAREINHHLKSGWAMGKRLGPNAKSEHQRRAEFLTAGAYASWVTQVEVSDNKLRPLADAVWDALEEHQPPLGWRASGAEDPIIVAAFDKGWPA